LNLTEQFDPQLIWLALLGLEVEVTVPLPTSRLDLLTLSGNVCSVNVAVTVLEAFIVSVQVAPFIESHPAQPVKSDPVPGAAVRVTTAPTWYELPNGGGLDVELTVPVPLPALATVNATVTVKLPVLVAVPPAVVTLTGPVVAPAGTIAWTNASDRTVKLAPAPLKVTAVAPLRFEPLMLTVVPAGPFAGLKLPIAGGAATANTPELCAVPPAVVTLRGPVVAPAGTVAWMAESETTVKLALVPLNATPVAPVKPDPLIVTLVPTGPLAGAKPEIAGGTSTVNELVLVAVPPGLVTLHGPVVAPAGTVAWTAVSEVTVKVAAVPLKATAVAPVKPDPLIVTLVPASPLVGEKPEIAGAFTMVNELVLVAVPPGVVTLTGPVVAPAGTVARTAVSEVTV